MSSGSPASGAPAAASRTYQYKLVLLGDSAVGKSSLVLRFVKRTFSEYQESTIGAAFLTQTIQLADCIVKFEIWDTAGQERYHSLAPMYYRGAAAAVVVYDVTSMQSFQRAKAWIKELQKQGSSNMIIALSGNKLDLIDKEQTQATAASRAVEFEEARSYAEENGLLFFECSAKNGYNVNELFRTVAQRLPKQLTTSQQPRNAGLQLDPIEQEDKSSCCG